HANATYAAMIASLDESVARLQAKLEELGLAERTVIVLTSDHGGLIGAGKRRVTVNVPLRAGKGSAYEGGVRVPLVVKWPGVVRPGDVCETPVMSIDFLPTLLEIAGVKLDRPERIDGRSFAAALRDPRAAVDREALYWHYTHYHPGGAAPYGAVRSGDFRLAEFYEDGHVELYNLREDIGEKRDLAAANPQQTARLRKMLGDWRKQVGAQMPAPNPDYQAP
ncbi:MAG TPA: sulfatase/phosphatase domain-containing protein, partial [Thermomicrobiales bacterium]|nr:sulfatase/phosphatase domain-containing protein [Thermomicrobiales bacterium]